MKLRCYPRDPLGAWHVIDDNGKTVQRFAKASQAVASLSLHEEATEPEFTQQEMRWFGMGDVMWQVIR